MPEFAAGRVLRMARKPLDVGTGIHRSQRQGQHGTTGISGWRSDAPAKRPRHLLERMSEECSA